MKHCSFLYSQKMFRFVDSEVSESFGNAFLVLKHDNLCLRFVKDRDQIFLDFKPVNKKGEKYWFSIDIVKQLVTGKIEESAEMDSEKSAFLKANIDEIEQLFSTTKTETTIKKLKDLERARAKRLFP
jgi:3-isopropylmalate dehydratase small subunit